MVLCVRGVGELLFFLGVVEGVVFLWVCSEGFVCCYVWVGGKVGVGVEVFVVVCDLFG